MADLHRPLIECLAPDRVGRHHVAEAEREAGAIQRGREPNGKLDEIWVDRDVRIVGIGVEYKAVVLIGMQEAFPASR